VTGWHRHHHRPGLTLPADTTARGGDFYLATSEDLYLATSGDFFMATDTLGSTGLHELLGGFSKMMGRKIDASAASISGPAVVLSPIAIY
jgi:hypothetical protein